MRQFAVLAAMLVAVAPVGLAASCTGGTLADYITLGAGGCTIGSNILYDFGVVKGSFPSAPISPTLITIAPIGGTLNPGITAATNSTANGTILEATFTYRISGNMYTNESITLAASVETGNGTLSDVQNYCAGGTFGPSGVAGCTGSPGNRALVDGVLNQDSALLGAVNLVSVTDDFTLDASQGGSVSGASITDQFTARQLAAVPEPLTFPLAGVGFALGLGLKYRSRCAGVIRKLGTKRPL